MYGSALYMYRDRDREDMVQLLFDNGANPNNTGKCSLRTV